MTNKPKIFIFCGPVTTKKYCIYYFGEYQKSSKNSNEKIECHLKNVDMMAL